MGRRRPTFVLAALALSMLASTSACAETCPSKGGAPARIVAVEPRLELRLSDSRLLRLAGVEPAAATPGRPDLADATRATLAAQVVGRPVTVSVLASRPDRWGRLAAFVALVGDDRPGGLAETVVAAGLGRVTGEAAGASCHAVLLTAEDAARAAKLGLWADPYYGVLAVEDREAFAERSGTVVLAEGKLVAVEPGPFRTVLRFAASRPRDRHVLAAVILPRVKKTFEAEGVMVQSLIGRTLRLRGLLDLRFGPRLELAGPDDIEIVAAPGR